MTKSERRIRVGDWITSVARRRSGAIFLIRGRVFEIDERGWWWVRLPHLQRERGRCIFAYFEKDRGTIWIRGKNPPQIEKDALLVAYALTRV